MNYEGKKVAVLGGFGFIGLNLIARLIKEGSIISVLDPKQEIPLPSLLQKINYQPGDIRDSEKIARILQDQDVLFNLAGKSGSANSMKDPELDLEVNCLGTLTVLEAARKVNPNIKIIFPGSRLEFGKVDKLPVSEDAPMHPTSIYGIHKLTAEKYHQAYFDNFGLRSTVLRISNPYGPHLQMTNLGYNIINYFFDLATMDEELKVFGKGEQKRDYLYVDDLIDLFLQLGEDKKSDGQVYNIGLGRGVSLLQMAETIVAVVGKGHVTQVPWDTNQLKLETGDYISDVSKIKRDMGWEPKNSPEVGITKTLAAKKDPYWRT